MTRRSLALGLAGLAAIVAVGPVGVLGATRAEAALPNGIFYSTVTSSDSEPFSSASSFSSNGASTFTRTSTGRYTFVVENLGGLGNAQLSMWDTGVQFPICTVRTAGRSSRGTRLKVLCNQNNGRPIDASFSLFYSTVRIADPGVGFAVFSTSTAASSTPNNQFRTRGTGTIKVKRVAKGRYQVTVPGETFNPNEGVVMTSATGANVRYCNPARWNTGGTDAVIDVECRRGNGSFSNSNFSFMMTSTTMTGTSTGAGASAWSASGGRNVVSALGPYSSYNSAGATNTDVDNVVGETLVKVPDIFTVPSTVFKLVVAYGPHRCGHLGLHGLDDDDITLNVHCRTITGSPIPSAFDVMVFLQPVIL